jgi:hypothetical protein
MLEIEMIAETHQNYYLFAQEKPEKFPGVCP